MKQHNQSFRSDRARVRGLGSAKDGTGHWWGMKLSSIALVPLTIWVMVSAIGLAGAGFAHAAVVTFLQAAPNAILMFLFLGFTLHHSANGLQVVIEDYVSGHASKTIILIANLLLHIAAAVVAFYSLILIAFKG